MSAFGIEAARIERTTSLHHKAGVTILTCYVRGAQWDGQEDAGFPVSGDMLAVIRNAGRHSLTRRRRRAASVLSEVEATE